MPEISPPRRGKKTLPKIYAKRGSETRTYEERVLEEEVYALLIKAIQNLPEQCQKVYLLVLEGKSNQEIAHQLQLKIETVKSHKQVGKKLLYDQLKHIIPVGILIFLLEF